MKVIDRSAQAREQKKAGFLGRARKRLSQTWAQKEMEAQEVVLAALQKILDNRYVMLRNVTLEGPDVPIPLILVGPQGVRVIYASTLKGVFRAREDNWEQLDDRTQHFNIARPNLLTRTVLMGRVVNAYLTARDQQLPEIEAILFFSDPGTHVDMTRPVVRIVLADALERYIAGLTQSRTYLDQEQVQKIVILLVGEEVAAGEVRQKAEGYDVFSFQESPPENLRVSPKIILDQSEPGLFRKIPFNKKQLLFLGALILVNILILASFVIYILISS